MPDTLPEGENGPPSIYSNCIHPGASPGFVFVRDLSRANAQEIMEAGLISATNGIAMSLPIEDHLFRE